MLVYIFLAPKLDERPLHHCKARVHTVNPFSEKQITDICNDLTGKLLLSRSYDRGPRSFDAAGLIDAIAITKTPHSPVWSRRAEPEGCWCRSGRCDETDLQNQTRTYNIYLFIAAYRMLIT